MVAVLLGPPGAGKGTQAAGLASRLGVPHVVMGDILRGAVAEKSDVGHLAQGYMNRGEYVPDDVILEIMRQRLAQPDVKDGFVLDGFPRTIPQAKGLDEILYGLDSPMRSVVLLEVPDEDIVQRVSNRRTCPRCGSVYNLISSPPAKDEICDKDGEEILMRADDAADVVRNRLRVYHRETEPMIAFYESRGMLRRVDGVGSLEEVEERIAKEIE